MKMKPVWIDLIKLIIAIILLVIFVFTVRYYIQLPDKLRQEVGQSEQDHRATKGELTVTNDTQDTMEERGEEQTVTREIIRENTYEIRNATGSTNETPVGVHNALELSIKRLREQANQRNGKLD